MSKTYFDSGPADEDEYNAQVKREHKGTSLDDDPRQEYDPDLDESEDA